MSPRTSTISRLLWRSRDCKSLFATYSRLLTVLRSANYISVAQIFLRSNALLTKEFTKNDVKQRLLGHFGTW